MIDPFAAPQNDTQEDDTVTDAPNPTVRPTSDGKVVVTLKSGAGYDAPWIVIHADSVADAASQIGKELYRLMELTQQAAEKFQSLAPAKAKPATAAARPAAPAAAAKPAYQQAPGGDSRTCAHGEMVFKSGVSKTGKAWSAFMCPAPQGTPDQCEKQWLH